MINGNAEKIIKNVECFALDMDGTVYLGSNWIDGALDFLDAVKRSGRRYCFMTNNSSKSADVYLQRLHGMGLDVDPKTQLVTSGLAAIAYLRREHPEKKVFLLGNDMLKKEFRDGGITLEEHSPEIVVTAFDTSLDYKKMCAVCDLVRGGLPYIATHPDLNCPTETGFVPDIGAISAFIEASTGRVPDVIVGKPHREIVDFALNITKTEREKTALVGDRLYTDIRAGVENGLAGILVLSGEATLKDVEASDVKPTLIFDSVKDIIPYL